MSKIISHICAIHNVRVNYRLVYTMRISYIGVFLYSYRYLVGISPPPIRPPARFKMQKFVHFVNFLHLLHKVLTLLCFNQTCFKSFLTYQKLPFPPSLLYALVEMLYFCWVLNFLEPLYTLIHRRLSVSRRIDWRSSLPLLRCIF